MKNLVNRLWNADPSKSVGWLTSFVSGLLVVLLYVAPFLDNLDPRLKGVGAFLLAVVIPKGQALLTALRAFKPATVAQLQTVAHEQGQDAARAEIAAEQAAVAKKVAKATNKVVVIPTTSKTEKAAAKAAPKKPRKK